MSILGDHLNAKFEDEGIQPGQRVGEYLDSVIKRMLEEGPKARLQRAALDEKDKQQNDDDPLGLASGGGDAGSGGDGGDASGGGGKDILATDSETPASPDTAEIGRQKGGPQKKVASDDVESLRSVPQLGDIIDKLNAVRSGKSLKGDDIRGAFEKYVGGLDDEEKMALFAFLKGLAQVTSGEVPGDQAVEPDTAPAPGIEMKKQDKAGPSTTPEQGGGEGGNTRSVKPNVIDKGDGSAKSPYVGKEPKEDTSGPMPVQVKRRG